VKTIEEREAIYRMALETYGLHSTATTCIQEIAKLVLCLIKFNRFGNEPTELLNQISLVQNVFGQLVYFFSARTDIEKTRDRQLEDMTTRLTTARSRGGFRCYASRYSDQTR
jgi:hypothetical protein